MNPPHSLIPVAEVAEDLEVSLQTVYKWIRLERVASVRNPLSGRLALTREEVERIRPFVTRTPGG
jgi:predicted site-specific integrase-resolvase